MHYVQRITQLLFLRLVLGIGHFELDDWRWIYYAAISFTETARARSDGLLSDHELVVEIPVLVSGIRFLERACGMLTADRCTQAAVWNRAEGQPWALAEVEDQ